MAAADRVRVPEQFTLPLLCRAVASGADPATRTCNPDQSCLQAGLRIAGRRSACGGCRGETSLVVSRCGAGPRAASRSVRLRLWDTGWIALSRHPSRSTITTATQAPAQFRTPKSVAVPLLSAAADRRRGVLRGRSDCGGPGKRRYETYPGGPGVDPRGPPRGVGQTSAYRHRPLRDRCRHHRPRGSPGATGGNERAPACSASRWIEPHLGTAAGDMNRARRIHPSSSRSADRALCHRSPRQASPSTGSGSGTQAGTFHVEHAEGTFSG
jgi:hypothetical protein